MAKFGRTVGKKAAKATVRHSARGVAAKAQRKPLRSISLISIGAVAGATAGWFAARRSGLPS
jgi:hypothetical protein